MIAVKPNSVVPDLEASENGMEPSPSGPSPERSLQLWQTNSMNDIDALEGSMTTMGVLSALVLSLLMSLMILEGGALQIADYRSLLRNQNSISKDFFPFLINHLEEKSFNFTVHLGQSEPFDVMEALTDGTSCPAWGVGNSCLAKMDTVFHLTSDVVDYSLINAYISVRNGELVRYLESHHFASRTSLAMYFLFSCLFASTAVYIMFLVCNIKTRINEATKPLDLSMMLLWPRIVQFICLAYLVAGCWLFFISCSGTYLMLYPQYYSKSLFEEVSAYAGLTTWCVTMFISVVNCHVIWKMK